jgi:hypothetical protein
MEKIGLIAGSDKFPVVCARAAKENGCKVIAIAINGLTDPELAEAVDKIHWVDLGQTAKVFQILLFNRIRKIILAGKIPKSAILKGDLKIDKESESILKETQDRKTDTLLKEVARRLSKLGITIMDSSAYLKDKLIGEGVLAGGELDEATWEEIRFGKRAAREIARLDIGQTVVVKNKDIIAVEGVEGTNEAIKRAGRLVGEGTVVVKVARPEQDMRFDVPIIGPETIDVLNEVKAKALAVQSGKTLVLEVDRILSKARDTGLKIVGLNCDGETKE